MHVAAEVKRMLLVLNQSRNQRLLHVHSQLMPAMDTVPRAVMEAKALSGT